MAYVTQVWSYRGLIGHLAQRELKSKYKRSVLGWPWSLVNPAATLLIYTAVFGTVLRIPPPVTGHGTLVSFALYLFSALVIWNFFNGVIARTGQRSAAPDGCAGTRQRRMTGDGM